MRKIIDFLSTQLYTNIILTLLFVAIAVLTNHFACAASPKASF